MPTYEYMCKRCGDTIEVVQSFKAKPLRRHEVCGGELQKVFHPRGVVFKGSGFYSTDSRPKKETKAKTSEPAEKKTESKEKAAAKASGATASKDT
jgi:putative FmdB family regulatory protein